MHEYLSLIAPLIQAYALYQQASDRLSVNRELSLKLFDRHCKSNYPEESSLTQEMVDTWCRQRDTEINNSCISRINPIVGLIRYLRERGKTVVSEPVLPRKERRTYIPHAFTEQELQNFFRACDEISDKSKKKSEQLRRITIPVFFRLLYSSGLRTCEARMLRTEDADLTNGILNIRLTKGIAQHYVVLHDSMLPLMKQYDSAVSEMFPGRMYFFPHHKGLHYERCWVQDNFRRMWDKYNAAHATAYELRHNYAVENINRWTNEGFSFETKLTYLSKSMGHSEVESTKYYYSLTPAMADILEIHSKDNDILPEVRYAEGI
jgi:integrase